MFPPCPRQITHVHRVVGDPRTLLFHIFKYLYVHTSTRSRMTKARFLFSFLFLACCTSTIAQPVALDAAIRAVMEKHQAVGTAAVVVKGGQLVYAQTFGHKSLEEDAVLGLTDLFRIASVSKSFTATAFMQLVEQERVSLDDDIGDLIGFPVRNPHFPDAKITLEMILSHTSSISDKNGYFTLDAIRPGTENDDWKTSYNDYAPGTRYQYCNLNYNMAGAILERLTGENFDNYIRQRILAPLHLDGGFRVDCLDPSRFATLYAHDDGKFVPQPAAYHPRTAELETYVLAESTPVLSPTGGMKISAIDLARYLTMHMNYGRAGNSRILQETSAIRMQTPVLESSTYGLGLLQDGNMIPGVTLVGHTGSAYGLYSNMFFAPQEKFGFVVITNGCQAVYEDGTLTFSKEMLQLLYDYFIR